LTVELLPQTFAWGDAFEHWVILEFVKQASYRRLDWELSYIRTKEGVEIDLVIDRPRLPVLLVEIKSKSKVTESDAKALETLGKDISKDSERVLLSMDRLPQQFGGTKAYHWQEGLRKILS
jgi:predicted AAA+ superfamily ATPase